MSGLKAGEQLITGSQDDEKECAALGGGEMASRQNVGYGQEEIRGRPGHQQVPSRHFEMNTAPPAPYFPSHGQHQIGHEAAKPDMVPRPVSLVRLIIDVILVGLAFVPIILLNTVVKPFQRGFYCDDESIRYPYKLDTITPTVLYVVGAVIVLVTVKSIIAFTNRKQRKVTYSMLGKKMPTFISSLYIYTGYCILGFIMTQLATDIAKNLVGRLRPHFIDICDPDWSQVNCSGYSYIVEPFCRGTNEKRLMDARVSFFSGHSSYSSYMMGYLVLYLHARWRWSKLSIVAKYLLQFGFAMVALYTGLSRISDYKHHWSDVLTGFAVGTFLACLTTIHIGKFFQREYRNGIWKFPSGEGLARHYESVVGHYEATDNDKHIY